MEKDGKTRLYYCKDHPYRVTEAWPEGKDSLLGSDRWTKGKKAGETYRRAEFICTSVMPRTGRGYWSVGSHHSSGDFKVYFTRKDSEDYANLAKKLEKRFGKKGLTILIS